jgi:hypothetical protein
MENTLKLPVAYAVLDQEELTYLNGGATSTEMLCAILPIPGIFYGWYKGATAVRDYRRAHSDTWLETGIDALVKDMEKNTTNMVYDVGCAFWTLAPIAACAQFPVGTAAAVITVALMLS